MAKVTKAAPKKAAAKKATVKGTRKGAYRENRKKAPTIQRGRGRAGFTNKLELVGKVCDAYATGKHTVDDCCKANGLSIGTFYGWCSPNTIFEDQSIEQQKVMIKRGFSIEAQNLFLKAIQDVEAKYMDTLKESARTGLLKRVQGHEYEETTTEVKTDADGNTKPVSIKRTTKVVQPDTTAIIFTLKNVDSGNFADKQQVEHSGVIATEKRMSDDDLEAELAQLEQKMATRLKDRNKK